MWFTAAVSLPAAAYGALAGRRALALFAAVAGVFSVWGIAADIGTSDSTGEENGFLILILAGFVGGALIALAPHMDRLLHSLGNSSSDGSRAPSASRSDQP